MSTSLLSMQLQNVERDFETEYFFRTCSVATYVVTSPDFNPFHCALMRCHFGQTRNGCIATYFIHFSSASTSSATGEYVAIQECFGQNAEPASRNEEPTRNKPSSAPKMYLNDAQSNHVYL